jgi:hypothetical protein
MLLTLGRRVRALLGIGTGLVGWGIGSVTMQLQEDKLLFSVAVVYGLCLATFIGFSKHATP